LILACPIFSDHAQLEVGRPESSSPVCACNSALGTWQTTNTGLSAKICKHTSAPRGQMKLDAPRIARVVAHPDGRLETDYAEASQAKVDSLLKSATPVAMSGTIWFGANHLASSNPADIIKMLDANARIVRPAEGWDQIASEIHTLSQSKGVHAVVVVSSAGLISFRFYEILFRHYIPDPKKVRLYSIICAIATALVALVLWWHFIGSVTVNEAECNKGYAAHQGRLSESQFKEACMALRLSAEKK
jgi:hypothetical protein